MNLYPDRAANAADLERALTAFVEARKAAAAGVKQGVDPALRERFRGQGYWGIVGEGDATGAPPAPPPGTSPL